MAHALPSVDRIPHKPQATRFLDTLSHTAGVLWEVGGAFAALVGSDPQNSDPILAVDVHPDGARLTVLDDKGAAQPATLAPTAHQRLDRMRLLAPLQQAAHTLAEEALAFPALKAQTLHHGTSPVLSLELKGPSTYAPDTPFHFHLMVGGDYGSNGRSISPHDLISEDGWRFHLLAHWPPLDADTTLWLWRWLMDRSTVVAPDGAQARLVFAARSASRSAAMRMLTEPAQPPLLWRGDDPVETARLLARLLPNLS